MKRPTGSAASIPTMTIDKRVSMAAALERVPAEGARLAFGGVTLYRRPLAFALALLAKHQHAGTPRALTLICFTAGLESDLLVGQGMVETVRSCYFGLEAFGLAPHFTKAAGEGSIQVTEESEASLASGLRAAMAGVGFLPSLAWQGTDLLKLRPDVKTVVDPYSGEELTAFPALEIDVAVIHALEADPEGNAVIGGNQGVDAELALVAEQVIVTAERIVPALDRADLISPAIDAVVEAPNGAWPTSCHPLYPLDGQALLDYLEAIGTEGYRELLVGWQARHNLAGA